MRKISRAPELLDIELGIQAATSYLQRKNNNTTQSESAEQAKPGALLMSGTSFDWSRARVTPILI
jgi:hypothetical protein